MSTAVSMFFHLDVAQVFFLTALHQERYVQLPGGSVTCQEISFASSHLLCDLKKNGQYWANVLLETVVKYDTWYGAVYHRTDPSVFRMVIDGKQGRTDYCRSCR